MAAGDSERDASGRAIRRAILYATFLFVVLALILSSTLVVYTAWLHDLKNGVFALLFAVLSAQIAFNWFLWRDEESSDGEGLREDSV